MTFLKGCGQKGEIVFVVDCSGSVGPVNFKRQQDFIRDMINPLHIGRNLFLVRYRQICVHISVIVTIQLFCRILRVWSRVNSFLTHACLSQYYNT